MRRTTGFIVIALAVLAGWRGHASAETTAASCAAHGSFQFVCGPANPEDFVAVPGTDEILVSGFAMPGTAAGKIYSVNAATMSFRELQLGVSKAAPDYAQCPGPLDLANFKPHGVALRKGATSLHTLYVVNHGTRESIEVFEVNAAHYPSALRWIGCVVLPAGTSGNGVAPLPDGGFVATKFYDTTKGPWMTQLEQHAKTGAVYAWHPKGGVTELEAGRDTGDNGIETSADGKWVFVNLWPERRVLRLAVDGKQPAASIPLDFMPDNIHLAPNGTLLVGGHIADMHILANNKPASFPVDWAVARIDPGTLKVEYLLWEKGFPEFQGATGAIEAHGRLWISTYRGDRLATLPLPIKPLQD